MAVRFIRKNGRIIPIVKGATKDAAIAGASTVVLSKALNPHMPVTSFKGPALRVAAGWGALSLGVRSALAVGRSMKSGSNGKG